ncbi:MAG: hydroxymyristoyl-ACP dehydratase [Gemmataceae bacterium]|nr:hydroxymyristoyl-ACP dehydratase [Gemmataceae bacterium]
MRFHLLDRITEVQPGRMLRAVKHLTLGEEYLADHFPGFPVMPGVLMLQTLVEAGSWLLRLTDDFAHSVCVLRDARNVKYGSFMEPGKRMEVTVELAGREGPLATFKGKGEADGQQTVGAKLVLASYRLAERDASLAETDDRIIRDLKAQCALLRRTF